ncbi:MAG: Rpp14/Pop5 family protein [Promethearchaeota archaeon]
MKSKERQRYILFKIIIETEFTFSKEELLKSIWSSIWRYFGMKEANKIGLWLVEFNLERRYGIIRCSHKTKESIITALTLISEINGNRVILSPLKTSGTIQSIKKKNYKILMNN